MKYKVGIYGSMIDESKDVIKKAQNLGEVLGGKDVILITGATTGISYEVIMTAAKYGSEIWGFSPKRNMAEQKEFTPDCDLSIYKRIEFIPKSFSFINVDLVCRKYRNMISTATCGAGIVMAGRWGSMNEFTNLADMGKVVGVLTDTGGIADELPSLVKKIKKGDRSKIVFSSDPAELCDLVLQRLKKI